MHGTRKNCDRITALLIPSPVRSLLLLAARAALEGRVQGTREEAENAILYWLVRSPWGMLTKVVLLFLFGALDFVIARANKLLHSTGLSFRHPG